MCGQAEDLVGFRAPLPLFSGLPVAQILVNPGNQGARKRSAEGRLREVSCVEGLRHLAINVENGRTRIGKLFTHGIGKVSHLGKQLTHVLSTGTGCSLIGHGAHPLNEVGLDKSIHRHQHERDRAVAADVVLDASGKALVDHRTIDRIKHDNGVVLHAQR